MKPSTLSPCRVYPAGPMSGISEHNLPAFRTADAHGVVEHVREEAGHA